MIIPKLGKPAYNTHKAFRPIVLLNTLGKLIEKMVARRLQFDTIKYGILYPNQLGGVAQWSTEDAGVFLTYLVQVGQAKSLKTSVIAFDIAQFFSSLNHSMLTSILRYFCFAKCIVDFFFSFINLLHSSQLQSMADYLQQVVYSFGGLKRQKPLLQADKDVITVRRDH